MRKTKKHGNKKKRGPAGKYFGGIRGLNAPAAVIEAINNEFPTNQLSSFYIEDQQIENFRRIINRPNDCVISALQIIGLLDTLAANLMRIISGGRTILPFEIESIFIISTKRNFDFKEMIKDDFVQTLKSSPPRSISFCGSGVNTIGPTGEVSSQNHVFLVGHASNGNLMYIDPAVGPEGTFCNLFEPDCSALIENQDIYYLLYNSADVMSDENLKSLGFNV